MHSIIFIAATLGIAGLVCMIPVVGPYLCIFAGIMCIPAGKIFEAVIGIIIGIAFLKDKD